MSSEIALLAGPVEHLGISEYTFHERKGGPQASFSTRAAPGSESKTNILPVVSKVARGKAAGNPRLSMTKERGAGSQPEVGRAEAKVNTGAGSCSLVLCRGRHHPRAVNGK